MGITFDTTGSSDGREMRTDEVIQRYFAQDGNGSDGGTYDGQFYNDGALNRYQFAPYGNTEGDAVRAALVRLIDADTIKTTSEQVRLTDAFVGGLAVYRSSKQVYEFCASTAGDGAWEAQGGANKGTKFNVGGSLYCYGASSAVHANTTGHTSIETTRFKCGANHWQAAAPRSIEMVTAGIYSNVGTPTLRFRHYLAGWEMGDFTVTCVSGAVNRVWLMRTMVTCLTGGSSGTIRAHSQFYDGNTHALVRVPAAGPINLLNTVDLVQTLQWGTASVSNSATVEHVQYKAMN